jgi:phage terminase large subunit-like protein
LIIDIIAKRRYPRTQLILPTQYGKSMAVADGVLLRIATHKEKWAIVAPSEDKARIIMDYIIDRIFDDVVFSEQLEFKASKEKLKQERSKTRIVFRDGGEVRVYSGNAGNTRQTKSALMGFGAPNIILDEAGQISDELYATVKRMVGGAEGTSTAHSCWKSATLCTA